jgi:tRNA (guanine37-N1)-methyltransferase
MPLPERAKEFAGAAILALKPAGGSVHYFAHVRADNKKASQEAALSDAKEAFSAHNHRVENVRVVREVGPRLYQTVADISVNR